MGILDEYLVRYRHFHPSESTRYEHLRTEVHDHFRIIDLYLKDGGRAVTTAADLAAHEAHRAEDWLMVVVNDYILGRRQEARAAFRQVRVGTWVAAGSSGVACLSCTSCFKFCCGCQEFQWWQSCFSSWGIRGPRESAGQPVNSRAGTFGEGKCRAPWSRSGIQILLRSWACSQERELISAPG